MQPATSGASIPPPGTRRARVALACQRCKGRKQKVSVTCVYEQAIRPRYPGGKMLYINALEERIAFLEARLPEYGEDHLSSSLPSKETHFDADRRLSHTGDDSLSEEDASLVDGVAYLSLCASGTADDSANDPFYFGSSSGASIARMIQSSIFRTKRHADGATPKQGKVARNTSISSISSAFPIDSALEFPPPDEAEPLFRVFFDRLHSRWPTLDRALYTSFFKRQYEKGAIPIVERSIMHLIYAISARYMQLTKMACEIDPEVHFGAAVEPMEYILDQHNVSTVQFLTLLAVFGQRSPYGAGVWSQVRYAITLCIELGLHRKPSASTPVKNSRDLEIRKRTFWSCYGLDRLTSLLLGRTFAIADRDINADLPSVAQEFWDLSAAQSPPEGPTSWSNIMPFNHIIRLRQIQSKIHRIVFRVDVTPAPNDRARLDAKMANIHAELDEWVKAIPFPPKDAQEPAWMYMPDKSYHDSSEYFTLQYHKTVLSLYTSLLPVIPSTDPRFISCGNSSAQICLAYRRLHQQRILSFTVIALHSCFIAGLTLIYCLWRDRSLFSYDVLDATRACSQTLTLFGEKWTGSTKYGDIFEALSGSVLRVVMNPGQHNSDVRQPKVILESIEEAPQGHSSATNAPVAPNPILGAVKEVFMEVDEEVPGGWQGWKMFNEMIQSHAPTTAIPQETPSANGDVFSALGETITEENADWDGSNGLYDADSMTGFMQMDSSAFPNGNGWDHGFLGVYE
ncbi:uncharacterized protein BDZ99DRAFT_485662 [Mytilinidion resinicola]|uniref:Xylanolytic transcriptional activator regulatory domain-containing protein n=1 Tax=Mytilinidion resinicola TaxID=574789 RepID=A0A6A6Z2P0_9PEZI|nr:uncharacterized protein BDZ99DRAFT_485662 [Mytilinidion resinicola]KAF2815270.1 hypothetical protein BDZ99DRAFT_485662 [Mytilinidion resinicola]